MKELMDLMKNKGQEIKPEMKSSKMAVIEELKHLLMELMGNDMDQMQKVTVAAKSPEDLEQGLSKAKEMVSQSPNPDMDDDDDEDSY